jgi:signal transduction histidine kinase
LLAYSPLKPEPDLEGIRVSSIVVPSADCRFVSRSGRTATPVDQALSLAAYGIVQESPTNVVKHAGAADCLVRLAHQESGVEIEILNRASRVPEPRPSPGVGFGLIGMHERARFV